MSEIINKNQIRLSKSCISAAEKAAVLEVLNGEYLGMGSVVGDFEAELQDYFSRDVVCVSSGTAALHLSLQGMGIGPGDEVLVQSLTYLASFQAIAASGGKPVAVDVNTEDFTIDLEDAEKKISSRTKAIMPVHYAGAVGDLSAIYRFAKKYGLRVLEDAAHAFGSSYNNQKVGEFGDVVCFSFDGIKNITCGEGGCIVSSDSKLLRKVSNARLLGVDGDSKRRIKRDRTWSPKVDSQGWRYHMSDIMAAIGIEQLKRFPILSKRRRELAKRYVKNLSNSKLYRCLHHDYDSIVPHIFPIEINSIVIREDVVNQLSINGIQSGIHYYPNHKLDYFKDDQVVLKNTDNLYKNILTLPLHPDLNDGDVDYICQKLMDLE